ncbi:MAG: 16S rRNA (cytosine(967)-C(5))-methyltransferase RsmB [Ruminococcus sp.]
MKNSREVAFDVLLKVLSEDAYSNLALDKAQKENKLSSMDSSFCTALVYGVLERLLTLDYIIRKLSTVPFRKIELKTLIILRMGLYQLLYMDKVPQSAAVNESVNLAKRQKLFKSSGFINGLLRSFVRAECKFDLPKEEDKLRFLSVRYSCPEYLVKLFTDSYSEALCEEILKSLSGRPPLTVRVNTLKLSADKLIDNLASEGVEASVSEVSDSLLELKSSGAVDSLKSFARGEFFVQNTASALCAEVASPKPGDTVFDVCSAPGGKAFNMAVNMENRGVLRAFDLHPHKIKLIEAGAHRLGIKIINASVRNAETDRDFTDKADVVLCDVPCSGFGILRRKPEIRYRKEESFSELPQLQYAILENSAKLVKAGGTLVYSTCTLNPAENNLVAERFLSEHPEFEPKKIALPKAVERKIPEENYMLTLFPSEDAHSTDGFFISSFMRKGE